MRLFSDSWAFENDYNQYSLLPARFVTLYDTIAWLLYNQVYGTQDFLGWLEALSGHTGRVYAYRDPYSSFPSLMEPEPVYLGVSMKQFILPNLPEHLFKMLLTWSSHRNWSHVKDILDLYQPARHIAPENTQPEQSYRSSHMKGFTEAGPTEEWDTSLGTVQGYRSWTYNPDGYIVGSYKSEWLPNGKDLYEATCPHGHTEVPYPDNCGCGFWAYWKETTASRMVKGVIEGSGRVVVGSKGFRSQFAKITHLSHPGKSVLSALKITYRGMGIKFFDSFEDMREDAGIDPNYGNIKAPVPGHLAGLSVSQLYAYAYALMKISAYTPDLGAVTALVQEQDYVYEAIAQLN